MSGPPDIALFFGRLHPLLVHLPIGLIALLAFLELLAIWPRSHFKQANANSGIILAIAAPLSLFTVACGWLLSLGGGYDERLLQLHKWTGIGTTAGCIIAGLLHRLDLKRAYRWCLFSTAGALAVAGHFGGSLTHGSDYLVRYAPGPLRALLSSSAKAPAAGPKGGDYSERPAFTAVIQPILEQNCAGCHGPERWKGGLRVDSFAALLKGGKSGPALVPGNAAESDMLKRMRLPVAEDDHMPPDGKPQPSTDEVAVVQWWIESGASADKKIGDLNPPSDVSRILASRLGAATARTAPARSAAPTKNTSPKPLKEIIPTAAKLADELAVPITALSPNEPWLQCNASIAGPAFGDADLAKLAPLGPSLRWLDLGGTKVTDAGLTNLSAMPNLVRLHLERTPITDSGLTRLAGLEALEYLNLYGTAVTDAGVQQLEKLPALKQLYLWQTKVTPEAAKAFAAAHTDEAQMKRWQEEIEQLKERIRGARVSVELGTAFADNAGPMSTNTAPINTTCPVSGKPIDPTKTVLYEGSLVALCCNDCKARFQQDPKPFLAKLTFPATNSAATTGGR